jgi:transposase
MVDGTLGSHRKEGTTKMSKRSILAAGVDTGKEALDVALSSGEAHHRVDNSADGWAELAAWLKRHRVRRVGIEASGGYERGVVAALRQKGIVVIVFQPIQVRAYATFNLKRAKNDRIDAKLIALCAAAKEEIREPFALCFQAFCEHLTLIEQIEEDIARSKTRLEAFRDERLRELLNADIKRLKAWRRSELKRLRTAIEAEDGLGHKLELIESIPGIAERTAIALLVRMPEVGTLSREEAAALAGLAPYDDQSGKRNGERHIAGGRARLRRSLFAAALPAAFHWNPNLIRLYRRLTGAGKSHKRALIACARKLIIYANTVVARGTPWIEPQPAS